MKLKILVTVMIAIILALATVGVVSAKNDPGSPQGFTTAAISTQGQADNEATSREIMEMEQAEWSRLLSKDAGKVKSHENKDEDRDDEDEEGEENTFELEGAVQSLTATSITVGGKTIFIDEKTEMEGQLAVGAIVEVEAVLRNTSLLALEIEVKRSAVTSPSPTTNVPAAPSGLTATAASATQINLSWSDNSSNESGFRIQRASNNNFTTGLTTFTVGAGVTAYNDTPVAASTIYYYRVFAYNNAGDSTPSNTASATTPAAINVVQIYSTYCAGCHGANRQGGIGPALTPTSLSGRTVTQIANAIANGVGSMPGYSNTLTPAEINALADWLKNTPP